MPEMREPVVNGGFWIRRTDYSPKAMEGQGKTRRITLTNNKENIPHGWRRSPAARFRRPGKSPLPDWYPRTPLRDITSIVKAYERKRLRIQAAQNTAASPAPELLKIIDPSPQGSLSTPSNHSTMLSNASITTAATAVETTPLQADKLNPQTPAPQTGQADDGPTPVILNSIDQIEKAVKRNMIAMKKPENRRATQLRNLMSMR